MRINNFISITQEDLSPLHAEIVSLYDSFILSANNQQEAEKFEKLFKQEYPTLCRLKSLMESILIGQQNTQIFDRIKDPESKKKPNKFKLVVSHADPTTP